MDVQECANRCDGGCCEMCSKALIIGGAGNMGQWFARTLKRQDYAVSIADIDPQAQEVASELGIGFVKDEDVPKAVVDFDIVLISVPINVTEEVISKVAPHMRPGSLLMDVTSVKKGPMKAMRKAPKGVEIIGTHPMFGPTMSEPLGQTVILVAVEGRCENWLPKIVALFEDEGAHVEFLSAEEHDQMMAVVQGLTHFAYIAVGATMDALEFDLNKSRRFMSPVYEVMVDFVGRILAQNPHLYAMIQASPDVKKVHDAFITQCLELSKSAEFGETEKFVRLMRNAASHFGDTESALRRSDKLVNAKITELETLANSIGEERGLRHIYSGVVHVGIVRKVTHQEVLLEKGGKRTELKIENVSLLSADELLQWKMDNLVHHRRDISVALSESVKPDIIAGILGGVDGVISVDQIDTYGIKKGHVSLTYRITIRGDKDPNEVQHKVEELLKGIGGEIR
ncbi:MAG: prephenate dehydrogenase [Methanocellales archaeon]|nr:prephenate dehydrogenase [Methanocellales archaeon]MDD3291024.1 prephenate dehydrogenase [Methanocellales archaeon]MDD5234909.1 prephenate dehydrogenase [Methanocellales archaeon]MDD5484721.1 prephenate dehydrogenase [Methanocellales archaeon]